MSKILCKKYKEIVKKSLCQLKGHKLKIQPYDDYTDADGRFRAGAAVICKKCNLFYDSITLNGLKHGKPIN